MSRDPQPPSGPQDRQHLATLLLAGAVHVTYALDQLHQLAASNTGDPTAAADVTAAIAAMTRVRRELINAADQLTPPPPHP